MGHICSVHLAMRYLCRKRIRVLSIFRTNQLLMHSLVLVYIIILWIPAWLSDQTIMSMQGGYVFQWILAVLPASHTLYIGLAIVLVWFQGLILNILHHRYRMGQAMTLFPGVMLAMLYSTAPEFTGLNPILVANTFLVLAMHQIFAQYRLSEPSKAIFNTGFLISIAGLTYFPLICFHIIGLVGLGIQRGQKPKEILQYLVGLILPWLFFSAMYYWTSPATDFASLGGITIGLPTALGFVYSWRQLIVSLILGAGVLYILSIYKRIMLGETIQVQKNIDIAYYVMLCGGISLLLSPVIHYVHWLTIILPMGFLAGLWMIRVRPQWAESFHFLLFVGALLYQYFPLLYL